MNKYTITTTLAYDKMSVHERLNACLAIRNVLHCGNQEALSKLRELGAGGKLEIHSYYMEIDTTVLHVEVETPKAVLSEFEVRQRKLNDLLIAGAAGVADAAIEYCRAELAGEVNHAAYAAAG